MKKLLAMLLCAAMIICLAACGAKEEAPAETLTVETPTIAKSDEKAEIIDVPKAADVPAADAQPVVEEPEPTATPEPTPTPVPTATPEPTPTPEPVAEDPVAQLLKNAVKSVKTETKYYMVNADGEYLWLGDSGWHISMSSSKKSPIHFEKASSDYYVIISEENGMRFNIYGGSIDVMNAVVAMYPNDGSYADNEMFKKVAATDDGLGFKLKSKGGLYLLATSASADASLTSEKNATVFYFIEETVVAEEKAPVDNDAVLAGLKAPKKAVSKISKGTNYYLSNGKGEYLWLGDNGWHISMSSGNKDALRFDKTDKGYYVLTSETWSMRVNVWDGKVGVMNAAVAMYPNTDDATGNEMFKLVKVSEDPLAFRLMTTGGLYLHVSSEEKDASITDEANGTIFFAVKK